MSDPTSTYLNQPLRSEAEAASENEDIVGRLRASFEGIPLCGKCAEAADEIEALRERVALLENDQALGESIILRQGASAEAANAINKEMVGVLERLFHRHPKLPPLSDEEYDMIRAVLKKANP